MVPAPLLQSMLDRTASSPLGAPDDPGPLKRTMTSTTTASFAAGSDSRSEAASDSAEELLASLAASPALGRPSGAPARTRLSSKAAAWVPPAAAAAAHHGSPPPPAAAAPAAELVASPTSWAAQQRARRAGAPTTQQQADAEVGRALRSILNKLTPEKFAELSRQVVAVGMSTTTHVEMLIHEIFEKATSQHHYIDMYADLCVLLSQYFALNPVGSDPKFSFKRLLLHECQASFERGRREGPPESAGGCTGDQEERELREFRHKRCVLGNMKLIGALLVRRMLAGKVFLAILAELVHAPTQEAMESAAALLTVAGGFFDTREWTHHACLDDMFSQLRSVAGRPSCSARTRCLLQDVLDLRAGGWVGRQRWREAAPSTLKEVSAQQAVDLGLALQ